MPASLTVTLANLLYFEKAHLPQALANRLIRIAAFQNPEFYKAQAMRLPVWDKPRVIGCAESYPHHIALPRGCLDAARQLLHDNGIRCELHDERFGGQALGVRFAGTLRPDQEAAVAAMLAQEPGPPRRRGRPWASQPYRSGPSESVRVAVTVAADECRGLRGEIDVARVLPARELRLQSATLPRKWPGRSVRKPRSSRGG